MNKIRESIEQSLIQNKIVNEDLPGGYFVSTTLPLRVFGLGVFLPLKDGSIQTNFPWKYVVLVTIPMSVLFVAGLPLMEIGGSLEVTQYAEVINSLSFTIVHLFSLFKIILYVYNNAKIQRIAYTLEYGMRQHHQKSSIIVETKRMTNLVLIGFSLVVNTTVICACIVASREHELPDAKVLHLSMRSENSSLLITDRFPFHVRVPFEARSSWTLFTVAYIYIVIAMLMWGYIITFFDTLIASFMLHIRCQLLILQDSLANITTFAYKRLASKLGTDGNFQGLRSILDSNNKDLMEKKMLEYVSKEQLNEQLRVCLGECVLHHQHIISCADDLEAVYSTGFLLQFLSSLGALCLNLCALNVVPFGVSFMIAAGFFSGMLLQLFAQCWAGNEVTLQSAAVGDRAYEGRWYCADIRFRRDLVLLMERAQHPLKLSAGGFAALSLEAFVSITRGAYSYFAVINTINN